MKPLWREFITSPHHGILAAATLGVGFLSAEPLYFIAGMAAYVVGWVFVPGMPMFQRYLNHKSETARLSAESGELAQFNKQRDALINSLSPARRDRYFALAKVCQEIGIGASADDPRVRKIEELMWTFLRLLTMEQSLDQFLETEIRDDVPKRLAGAKEEVERLRAEVAALGAGSARDAKERLLISREELLETMQQTRGAARPGEIESRARRFRTGAARSADQTHPRRFRRHAQRRRPHRAHRRDRRAFGADQSVALADGPIPRTHRRSSAYRAACRLRRKDHAAASPAARKRARVILVHPLVWSFPSSILDERRVPARLRP